MRETKFKQTEVGLIPYAWDLIPLGQLFDFKNGLNKGKEFFGFGTPIVNFTDVFNNPKMYKSTIKGLVSVTSNDIKSCNAHKGDVFFTRTSETPEEVGMSSVLLDDLGSAVFSGFVLRARPKTELLDSEYSGICMRSNCIRRQIINSSTYTTRALTSGSKLSEVLLPLPSLSEQRKIAKALSDIDSLISSLTKLIEKKQNIKTGTMQQLLTGKKRLEGFTEPWVEIEIGKLGRAYNGLTGKSAKDFGHGSARYITFLNVLNNPVIDTSIFEKVVVSEGESQNTVRKGDLLFNTSSETPSEVGICSTLLEDIDELFLNSFCFGFRPIDSVDSLYMSYWFRSSEGRYLMNILAQGSTRYNLSKENMMKSIIKIPSKDEQLAIANILNDMDAEIHSLKQKLAKHESIKKGMMQELLTGKIRLV